MCVCVRAIFKALYIYIYNIYIYHMDNDDSLIYFYHIILYTHTAQTEHMGWFLTL